mmetsp:Transcript_22719/g.32710  ORF Transcript_22719/g.32710 Transcript_22719/m.32710 type:complete len:208 (-) Transcript_22719:142-765(-)
MSSCSGFYLPSVQVDHYLIAVLVCSPPYNLKIRQTASWHLLWSGHENATAKPKLLQIVNVLHTCSSSPERPIPSSRGQLPNSQRGGDPKRNNVTDISVLVHPRSVVKIVPPLGNRCVPPSHHHRTTGSADRCRPIPVEEDTLPRHLVQHRCARTIFQHVRRLLISAGPDPRIIRWELPRTQIIPDQNDNIRLAPSRCTIHPGQNSPT